MNKPELCALVAVAENGVIGRNNALPWRLRTDLQRFKQLTMGHSLIMGRKTYESIGRPLPGRKTIVLSRTPGLELPGVSIANSIDQALSLVPAGNRAFVVGGAEIYRLAMDRVTDLFLTRVLASVDGDATLDIWDTADFECVEECHVPADSSNEWPTLFQHLVRRSTAPRN
jgi:dihydrofolate reductase